MDTPFPPRTTVEIAEDLIWLYQNYCRLCEVYGKQVIAVYQCQVIAHQKSFGALNSQLRESGYRLVDVPKAYLNTSPDFQAQFAAGLSEKIAAIKRGDWI